MKKTGDDMKNAYKETALGGLAWDFNEYDDDGIKREKKMKKFFATNMAECWLIRD